MPRCKPGDLAIGVHPSIQGAMFEVLEWVGPHPQGRTDVKDYWMVKTLSRARIALSGVSNRGVEKAGDIVSPGVIGLCSDSKLCPLRGDPKEAERETEAPTKIKEPA